MIGNMCASGGCRNPGIHRCSSCKSTFYCTKHCQKTHWKRHKVTCNKPEIFPPLRPGVFDFMRLPREVRDKIYAEVIVNKFTRFEQSEYNELYDLQGQPDPGNKRRDRLNSLERHLMVSPAFSLYKISDVSIEGFKGFKPLVNARGLLHSNKQISQELMETHFSKNTFRIRIQEEQDFNPSGQPYREYITLLAQRAKRLYLEVTTNEHYPGESGFQACVDAINYQLHDIVTSLNQSCNRLDSLAVRYSSCFFGEIEDLRIDADGLAAHKEARVIWVIDNRTDEKRSLNHTDMKQLYLHSATIANALCALDTPVSNFRIFGDLSGPDLSRISHKFNISVPEIHEKLDKYGQRINEKAEEFRDMATKHPQSAEIYMKMVRMHEQIFSTRAVGPRSFVQYGQPASIAEYRRQLALTFPR